MFLEDQSDKTSVRFGEVGPELLRKYWDIIIGGVRTTERRLRDEVHKGNEGRCEMPPSVAGGSQGRKARLSRLRVSVKRDNLACLFKPNGV